MNRDTTIAKNIHVADEKASYDGLVSSCFRRKLFWHGL